MEIPTVVYFTHFSGQLLGGERLLVDLLNSFEGHYDFILFALKSGQVLRSCFNPSLQLEVYDVDYPCYPYTVVDDQDVRMSSWQYARFLRWYFAQNIKGLAQVRRILRGRHIDLVHSLSTVVPMGSLYALAERKPHIWHAQETIAYRHLPQRVWLAYMQLTSRVIVGISERTARDYGRKSVVINNGVQVGRVSSDFEAADAAALRREFGVDPNEIILSCIGTLQPGKGQHILLQALACLCERDPERAYRLFLVGPAGREPRYAEYADKLKSDASRLGLEKKVHFTGYRSDYLAFVKLADICAHPATLDDSYPAAVRDPMLCGKPVVGSRTGGIPEMIEDGVTGLLVEPSDPLGLANAIDRLATSPSLRRYLSERASAFALQHFDARRTARQVEDLYRSLLGN